MSAYQEFVDYLLDGEVVESIVFGDYGGIEPNPPLIPEEKRGICMSLDEAEPLMKNWNIYGGFGCAECYALYAWTNLRIIFIKEYDGSTALEGIFRFPSDSKPTLI